MPIMNIAKQKPSPPAVCPLLSPSTITLKISPNTKPKRLPVANSKPVAVPSPTGKASSHPNSSMIGTKGMRKNELYPEAKLAQKIEQVYSSGQKMNIALIEPKQAKRIPIMHTTIHFLNTPLFLCIGPITITPMMPETTGHPPTAPTAKASSSPPNHGSMRKERMTEIPLKMPKQHPKASSINKQSLLRNNLRIAVLKGSFGAATEAEGGVGGFSLCPMMLSRQQQQPMIASTNIVLKASCLPSSLLAQSKGFGLQSPKTKAGTKMPSTSETFRMSVSS